MAKPCPKCGMRVGTSHYVVMHGFRTAEHFKKSNSVGGGHYYACNKCGMQFTHAVDAYEHFLKGCAATPLPLSGGTLPEQTVLPNSNNAILAAQQLQERLFSLSAEIDEIIPVLKALQRLDSVLDQTVKLQHDFEELKQHRDRLLSRAIAENVHTYSEGSLNNR